MTKQNTIFPKDSQIDARGSVSSLRVRINRVWAQRPRCEAVFRPFSVFKILRLKFGLLQQMERGEGTDVRG